MNVKGVREGTVLTMGYHPNSKIPLKKGGRESRMPACAVPSCVEECNLSSILPFVAGSIGDPW